MMIPERLEDRFPNLNLGSVRRPEEPKLSFRTAVALILRLANSFIHHSVFVVMNDKVPKTAGSPQPADLNW
jgi:hypothetical protein